jgi:putative SOS response-associated peptidase YedK
MATTPPNALIARITDRMPAILPREAWATWLGETQASLAEVKELLRTYEDGGNWTMEPQTSTRPARHPTSQSRRHRENCSRREAKKQRPRSRLSQILSPHSD